MSYECYKTDVKKIKFEENNKKLTRMGATYEHPVVDCFTTLCKQFSTKNLDDRSLQVFYVFNNKSKFSFIYVETEFITLKYFETILTSCLLYVLFT